MQEGKKEKKYNKEKKMTSMPISNDSWPTATTGTTSTSTTGAAAATAAVSTTATAITVTPSTCSVTDTDLTTNNAAVAPKDTSDSTSSSSSPAQTFGHLMGPKPCISSLTLFGKDLLGVERGQKVLVPFGSIVSLFGLEKHFENTTLCRKRTRMGLPIYQTLYTEIQPLKDAGIISKATNRCVLMDRDSAQTFLQQLLKETGMLDTGKSNTTVSAVRPSSLPGPSSSSSPPPPPPPPPPLAIILGSPETPWMTIQ